MAPLVIDQKSKVTMTPCSYSRITGATVALCLAAATHSFLLFSFFPYAGYMAVTLLQNHPPTPIIYTNGAVVPMTVNNVGVYAGMLGTTFTLGRFVGFVPWKVRTTYKQ